MSWAEEMATAYSVGVRDGKEGLRRGSPNDLEACYEEGWQHGKRQRTEAILTTYSKAQQLMRESLA